MPRPISGSGGAPTDLRPARGRRAVGVAGRVGRDDRERVATRPSSVSLRGLVQRTGRRRSSLHLNVERGSLLRNANRAVLLVTVGRGPEVILVCGAMRSAAEAGVGGTGGGPAEATAERCARRRRRWCGGGRGGAAVRWRRRAVRGSSTRRAVAAVGRRSGGVTRTTVNVCRRREVGSTRAMCRGSRRAVERAAERRGAVVA